MAFYLAYLLTYYLAYLLTFYLAFSLAFYMALFLAVEVPLRSDEATNYHFTSTSYYLYNAVPFQPQELYLQWKPKKTRTGIKTSKQQQPKKQTKRTSHKQKDVLSMFVWGEALRNRDTCIQNNPKRAPPSRTRTSTAAATTAASTAAGWGG